MRLGLARERQQDYSVEICAAVAAVAEGWGWTVNRVDVVADESACEVLLAVGSPSPYPDLVRRTPTARRVLWHGEPLYSRRLPGGAVHRHLPTGRLLDGVGRAVPSICRSKTYGRWRDIAGIVRESLRNSDVLRRNASAFDRLVMDSRERAAAAAEIGIRANVVPLGYHEAYAGALRPPDKPRDIDALFVGGVAQLSRRRRLVRVVTEDLHVRGTVSTVVSGALFGLDRRRTLQRTRIVFNIHRIPGNFDPHRFIVASAAGAAIVSEPFVDSWPLVAGVHYLESAVDKMPATIAALLADEPRRRRIVDAAQEMLRTEMSLERVLPRVLGSYIEPLGPAQ